MSVTPPRPGEMTKPPEPITEDWLRTVGFKWHDVPRSGRHWLLWLEADDGPRFEDLGLELCANPYHDRITWFCWLRSDMGGRYSRFVHIRHLHFTHEVVALVEALTDRAWNLRTHIGGSARTPQAAERYHAEYDRLDRRMLRELPPWHAIEQDDTMGGALPDHLQQVHDAAQASDDG